MSTDIKFESTKGTHIEFTLYDKELDRRKHALENAQKEYYSYAIADAIEQLLRTEYYTKERLEAKKDLAKVISCL